jgi:hypothetical protein
MEKSVLFKCVQSRVLGFSIYMGLDEGNTLEFLDSFDKSSYDLDNLLLVACWKSTGAVIRKFIELGADPEALSLTSTTPIMFVAQRDMLVMFKYFVSLGIDPMRAYQHGDDQQTVEEYIEDSPKITKYMREYKDEKLALTRDLEKKCEDFESQIRMLTEQLAKSQVKDDHCDQSRKRPKSCASNVEPVKACASDGQSSDSME